MHELSNRIRDGRLDDGWEYREETVDDNTLSQLNTFFFFKKEVLFHFVFVDLHYSPPLPTKQI